MGRERERKSSVQQLWQAKPRGSSAAASSPAGGEKVQQLGGAVYGEEAGGLGTEQEAGVMRGGGAAEGSSAASMKDLQANRTKLVVRHLPPSLSEQVFLEQIESKYGDAYTWVAFFPGKSSHRRHIHSRAYINFKTTDHVFDFYEEFDGHVFVSERGAQFKAVVEYAPYQRAPELTLKKDVREGTIFKDPEYLEFTEMLAKPMEYLPSAEVQLERREAEKAASMASGVIKESAIITPLMEYVRSKRAAKAAPQRSASFSRKLALRAGIGGTSPKSFNAKKRGVDRSKAHIQMHSLDSTVPTMPSKKEVHVLASPKEEPQGDRDIQVKRRNDRDEVKDRKMVSSPTLRGNSIRIGTDVSKEIASSYSLKEGLENSTIGTVSEGASFGVDVRKDVTKKEILRKLIVEKAKKEVSSEITYGNSLYSNKESGAISLKHRPPVSPKITSAVQEQQRAPSPGGSVPTNSASKQMHRRETAARSSRGSLSLSKEHGIVQLNYPTQNRDHSLQAEKRPLRQISRTYSKDHGFSISTSLSPLEAEVGSQQLNLELKVQADGLTNNHSAIHLASPISGSDRQDARRVKNKDRPDRPVWTPRRRAENSQEADISMPMATSTKLSESLVTSLMGSDNTSTEMGDTSSYNRKPVPSMGDRESEQQLIGLPFNHESIDGTYRSIGNSVSDNHTLGAAKIASRKDRIIQGVKEHDGGLLHPEAGKPSKRNGGAVVFTANEKQIWVAKST